MRRLLQLIQSHIRYKIVMPYLALTIFVTMAGAAIVLFLVAANAQDVLTNRLANNARAISDALVRREQGHVDFLRIVALSGASVENDTPSVAAAFATGNTGVVSKTLNVFYLGGITNINLELDRMIAFDRRGTSLIDWQRIADDPLPYFYTAAPVRQNDQVVGGLLIAIKIDRLLVALQRNADVPITTFYNLQGEALGTTFVPRSELASLNMRPEIIEALANNRAQSVINSENSPTTPTFFANTIQKREYELAYSPLFIQNKIAGFFSVALPTDFQVNSVTINRTAIALIALVLALGSILLGYRIARSITRPLSALVDTAEAVTAGDLERRTAIQSTDEFGRLALAFNQMTEHLLRLYRTSRELGTTIEVQPVLDVAARTVEAFAPGTEVLALLDDRGAWRYRLRAGAADQLLALQNLRVSPG